MRGIVLRAACLLASACASPAPAQDWPISVETISTRIQGKLVAGHIATVDLTDPRVQIVVSDGAPGGVVTRRATDQWATDADLDLAINANYFGVIDATQAQLIGLSIANGVLVSSPRRFGADWDPALAIRGDGTALAGSIGLDALDGLAVAVAGVGPSDADAVAGTMLIDDGVNLGATARVSPATREPRTAIGTNADGTTLFLAVIDGRQPGWSEGVTLPDLADLLLDRGVFDAVNLDGGGSSSFVYSPPDAPRVTNRPSDGAFRAVANSIGVRVREAATGPTQRPIRGVWLRPPGLISQFAAEMALLKEAGVTDVFLETFYWGLSTSTSDIFNNRYSSDYMQQAICAAAAHGIRVHAWLEAAYWSFSGSGNYILDQHPDWKVVDVNGATNIGDIAGQVFVNLANTDVQQMLEDYAGEIADRYPGLAGIQTDYHRYPLDNNTGDAFPGPYSYDNWTRTRVILDHGYDPGVTARKPGDQHWNDFVAWRRAGIGQAAARMHSAIDAVDTGQLFSAAIFPSATTSATQLVKMQDWPAWSAGGFMDAIVPMAYGTSATSIRSDLELTIQLAGGRRILAGLAILTNTSRPSITQQLDVAKGEGLEDFILFDSPTLTSSASKRQELKGWLLANATAQAGDFDRDGYIDARDRLRLFLVWNSGPPTPATGANAVYDLTGDGLVDAADRDAFEQAFYNNRFGDDGVVNARDVRALLACFTTGNGTVPTVLHVYDLDGDGRVDYDDQLLLHARLTEPMEPDADVNRDGLIDVDDMHEQNQRPIDVDRDGLIGPADLGALEVVVRTGENLGAGGPR